ncbi:hypothetical protein HER10_EVM0003839 [Colletotrichum scovillei]|uniref:uncharacterized protein n=1 Tax=Colletotrichum scovillei TaxID=1209932 RepID=UPI0015C39EFD|nr:uncharacterized protein HER10_EVM0003839 [Colletotrichum scovillei]KAF4772785.1 hypothetical protein HER10_EVM0003839 [Colletotrichum scovillei]
MSAPNDNTLCAANNIVWASQADDLAFNSALDSYAGDDGNDPIEPPPQDTPAVYSAPAVSTWNAGLSPSPPPLISLSIPSPALQFSDFPTSRLHGFLLLCTSQYRRPVS